MATNPSLQLFVEFPDSGPLQAAGLDARLALQLERLAEITARPGVVDARPIFTRPARTLLEEQAALEAAGSGPLPDLTRWIRVRAQDAEAVTALETALTESGRVSVIRPTYLGKDGAWHRLKQRGRKGAKAAAAPLHRRAIRKLESQAAAAEQGGEPLRDLSIGQRYLLSAPWGLGVVDVPGWPLANQVGDVRVGVIDDYWNKEHVDLADVEVAAETGVCHDVQDHGTNGVGIILASAKNRKGLVGLAAGAKLVFAYPYVEDAAGNLFYSVADAISRASDLLRPGDVLLIERQIASKAVELAPVCFDAIRHAVAKGIVVVEPAGNGGYDLDATDGKHFAERDSGSILVGAGLEASPQRLFLNRAAANKSCYGSRVDVQALGVNVLTTTGKGSVGGMLRRLRDRVRSQPDRPEEAFTDGFNGTSSASAIVAGGMAVACSVAKALDPKGEPLSPATLRELVVRTGSPQSLEDTETRDRRVGVQPNLPALLRAIRETLYERNHVPGPSGERPQLTREERWLVQLISSGLGEAEVAERMKLEPPAVRRLWGEAAEKLEASSPLAMARAADHWGLL